MAGKQHEEQESTRKGQIADESGKREFLNNSYDFEYISNSQHASSENRLDGLKIEHKNKIDVHFFTLSIMNEENKVILIF